MKAAMEDDEKRAEADRIEEEILRKRNKAAEREAQKEEARRKASDRKLGKTVQLKRATPGGGAKGGSGSGGGGGSKGKELDFDGYK